MFKPSTIFSLSLNAWTGRILDPWCISADLLDTSQVNTNDRRMRINL